MKSFLRQRCLILMWRKTWRKSVLLLTIFLLISLTRDTVIMEDDDAHMGIVNADHVPPTPAPIFPEDSLLTDRILEQLQYSPTPLNRTIVIYTTAFPVRNEFDKADCPIRNCLITNAADQQNSADAIIFKGSYPIRSTTINPEQIWIFYELECPMYTQQNLKPNSINWTATYRWDSDIVAPYERFTRWRGVPEDQLVEPPEKLEDYSVGKTKQAVWFASHCKTPNNREGYVKELSLHMSVDSYGVCGDQRGCPRHDKTCWDRLNKEYKFYLSFENSNCRDYVTEKFFVNGLGYNTIPVVMGAPLAYYERISPPHSFIHVDQFENAQKLAQYLKYLDSNTSAYNEYFKWKGSGKYIHTKFWCRLCNLLNGPRPRKLYTNMKDWWRGKDQSYCHNTGAWGKLGQDW